MVANVAALTDKRSETKGTAKLHFIEANYDLKYHALSTGGRCITEHVPYCNEAKIEGTSKVDSALGMRLS